VHIVSLFEHNVLVKDIQYTTSPPVSLYILTQRSVSGFLHPRPTSQLIGKPPITDPFITNNNSYSDNWIEHYSALMEFEAMVKFNSQRLPIQYEINHFDSNRTYPPLPCGYWVQFAERIVTGEAGALLCAIRANVWLIYVIVWAQERKAHGVSWPMWPQHI
jgi:hypothetical protein